MPSQRPSLIWRLQAPGSTETSYLFGTMHVKDRRAFAFFDQACACIDECEALALELDLSSIEAGFSAALMRCPPGQSMGELLPERKLAKMRAFVLRSLKLDLQPLRHLSPFVVSNIINERLLSADMPVSLDEALWKYASQTDKAIIGIETYAEQLAVLDNIPLEAHLQSLLAMLRKLSRHRKHILHLAARYADGDLPGLHRSAKRGLSGTRQLMLYHRNAVMADRIAGLIRQQRVFCAIGAGHLSGGKGVIRLLKQQHGVIVRPFY